MRPVALMMPTTRELDGIDEEWKAILIEMTEKAYLKGLENGDVTFVGFAGHGISYSRYIAGFELEGTINDNQLAFIHTLDHFHQPWPTATKTALWGDRFMISIVSEVRESRVDRCAGPGFAGADVAAR